MKPACRVAALVFAPLLFGPPPATPIARGEGSVVEWAPESSLVFIGVPDWDRSTENARKTQSYRSMQDPDVKEAVQPWLKLLDNAKKLVAGRLGLEDPKELEVLPHGGVAFFMPVNMDAADENDQLHACLVADLGSDAERARAIADKVVRHCVEKGGKRASEESGGTEIVTITFKEPAKEGDAGAAEAKSEEEKTEAKENASGFEALFEGVELDKMQMAMISGMLGQLEPPDRFAFAFAGRRLVIATSTDTVKQTLARLRGGSDGSLAAQRDVRAFAQQEGGPPDLVIVLSIPVLVNAIAKDEGDQAGKVISALGADALGPLVLAARMAPGEGVDWRFRGFLRIESRPHGLGRIFMMRNVDTAPPSGVSADTAVYASINLDPPLIMEEVLAIAEQIDPDSAEQMRESLKLPQEEGDPLDIRTDVVNHLAGPLTFAFELARPFDADHINMLVRLGHKSRDAMNRLAALLPKGMFMPGEILGHKIYRTPLLLGMAMGFTDHALIPFATQKGLEGYLRSEGQSGRGLAETSEFRRVARHVPAQTSAMLYANGHIVSEAQVAMAEEGKDKSKKTDDDAEAKPQGLPDYIRTALAEMAAAQDIKVLKASQKYQSSMIMTMSTESDGLRFDGVLVPKDAPPE